MAADAPLPLSPRSIERQSTADQVADALRDLILSGELEVGSQVREVALAKGFGVSRNTVREATQILERDGLVTRQMHRGAHVARLTAADVHDLYQVRRLVELSALDSAVEGADLSGVRFALRALKLAVEQDDMATTVEADLQFHRALADLLGSPRIAELYRAAQTGTRLCLALFNNRYEDPRALVDEHEAILVAIEDGDRERAGRLLSEHLDEAEVSIARMIGTGNGASEDGDEVTAVEPRK